MADNTLGPDPFKQYYEDACRAPSDIYYHLPILAKYALKCNSVVELGVRDAGGSTKAFLFAATRKHGPWLKSYDIDIHPIATRLFNGAKLEGLMSNTLKETL